MTLWPSPLVAADMSSCFALVAHHRGWWDVQTAEHLGREDVTEQVCQRSEKVAADPAAALDPVAWRHFGITLCETRPRGQRFMVEVEDEQRPDGRTEVVPLRSGESTAFYAEPDVEAASVLSGRPVEVVKAVRYVPEGRQANLRRRLAFLPGLVLDTDEDPVLAIVRRRQVAKLRGRTDPAEKRLARTLHAMVNSLVSGNPSRLDPLWQKTANGWRRWEKPGPWCFMAVAVSVQAGAHLLLAVLDRMVRDLGGSVVYRDTDSSFILASPDGGALSDGRRVLTWAEVDNVLRAFEPLSLPGWPVWKTERGTPEASLRALIFGPKRHIELVEKADGPELVGFTEANLGGQFVAPPGAPGRGEDGHYAWVRAIAQREACFALDHERTTGPAARSPLPWDAGEAPAFPSLRRLPVTTPGTLASLPGSLGARPGSRYLSAVPYYKGDHEAIVLDRGGDLSYWQALPWLDRCTGERRAVTMADDGSGLVPEPLRTRAVDWTRPPKGAPVGEVVIDPMLVQHVGRGIGRHRRRPVRPARRAGRLPASL